MKRPSEVDDDMDGTSLVFDGVVIFCVGLAGTLLLGFVSMVMLKMIEHLEITLRVTALCSLVIVVGLALWVGYYHGLPTVRAWMGGGD